MEDAKEVQDTMKQVNMNGKEHEEIVDELWEFRELEKMKIFLGAENERLKNGNRIKLDNIYAIPYNHNNEVIPKEYICPFLGREAWIAWDGTFNVCCAPDNLRKTLGYYGNIDRNNFMELWNNEKYIKLVNNWGSYDVCKMCNMRKPKDKIGGCIHE